MNTPKVAEHLLVGDGGYGTEFIWSFGPWSLKAPCVKQLEKSEEAIERGMSVRMEGCLGL